MKKLTIALIAFLIPTFLSAQIISRTRTFSQLGTCSKDGEIKIITDAASAGTCAGGGTSLAACWCDLGTASWISTPLPAAALGSYVPVTKAGQQTITATGVDNDITLTAPDTIVLSIAGLSSLVASSGGDNFALFTSGATNSELNISAGNDADGLDTAALSLYSEDDAATFTMELSNTGPKLSAEQSTGLVTVSRAGFRISPTAAPTVACAGGTEGTLYLDSDTHLLCVCNGTGYVQVADGSTACS